MNGQDTVQLVTIKFVIANLFKIKNYLTFNFS